jgi:EPS-associated MarR family transcriptional regulator
MIVQNLNYMSNRLNQFNILRKINSKPNSSQRELAYELGFSIRKLNYCLKALKDKGLIKITNFQKNTNKLRYFYILTPNGVTQKTNLIFKLHAKKNERI